MNNYEYPLLNKIHNSFKSQENQFKDVYILACQHLLEPQAKMFKLMSDFGVPKENIHIFGKIYSTNNETVEELIGEGFKVSKPVFDSIIPFDVEHNQNCRIELEHFLSSIKNQSKIIVLDDGGELLKIINDQFESIPSDISIIGIEQTSSGFRKLEHLELCFPIFNVARSALKLIKESPLIANLGCNRIINTFVQYEIKEPRILVVGLGPMGSNTLSILRDKGYFTIGYDIAHHDKAEIIDLVKNNSINVIIGVTGANILDEQQLQEIREVLEYKLYLISMSSADREFPTVYIRKNGITPTTIHGDVVWDNIVLVNNGFPITFKGNRYESTPEEIEKTIGLLYGSTLEAIVSDTFGKVGFIEVPKEIIDILEYYE